MNKEQVITDEANSIVEGYRLAEESLIPLLQEKDNLLKATKDGIETFLSWLKENRPNLTGAGAPIVMLENILAKLQSIK